jgi:hypothetical protein
MFKESTKIHIAPSVSLKKMFKDSPKMHLAPYVSLKKMFKDSPKIHLAPSVSLKKMKNKNFNLNKNLNIFKKLKERIVPLILILCQKIKKKIIYILSPSPSESTEERGYCFFVF